MTFLFMLSCLQYIEKFVIYLAYSLVSPIHFSIFILLFLYFQLFFFYFSITWHLMSFTNISKSLSKSTNRSHNGNVICLSEMHVFSKNKTKTKQKVKKKLKLLQIVVSKMFWYFETNQNSTRNFTGVISLIEISQFSAL